MNDLNDLIGADAIVPKLTATSRRHALQGLSDCLAKAAGLDPRAVFEATLLRERLGGTGVGDGVALPHATMPGLKRPIGAFARLDPPQEFEALDGRAADLVFLLLSPADRGGDHLKAVARISRFMRRADMRERLRAARSVDEIHALLSGGAHVDAA
ncbi:MAG: PTS sugar transporter subunit IIA [Hyphomonadaceae bacterium]|nr:PTS sugar transporter subunit IIA [Hyphomonadaceae bacterium]